MLCFSMFCVSAGSKSNLAKAAGAEVAVERRHEKWHAAVARSTFSIKMRLSLQVRTTFWSCDVEKLHAAVARSTFSSQNVQNTSWADHFLKLRCRKIARRCSEKHICKSKCQKTEGYGPLFDVHRSRYGGKMARRCGAKHIYKSKCQKHLRFASFLEVD